MSNRFTAASVNLLSRSLEERSDLREEEVKILSALYTVKNNVAVAVNTFPATSAYLENLVSVDFALGEILKPAIISDPMIIKVEQKPELDYVISGYSIKFKVDTGAVASVVDAENIIWPLATETEALLGKAYDSYVDKYPDDGPMTQAVLSEFDESFRSLDFGKVESFDMVVHRHGKDDTNDPSDKEKPNHLVSLTGSFDVIGVSNPKVKGARLGFRPVINLPIQGPGFKANDVYPFSLVKRDMTRRGLVGRRQLKTAGMSIVFDDRNTDSLALEKVDFAAVSDALKIYMK